MTDGVGNTETLIWEEGAGGDVTCLVWELCILFDCLITHLIIIVQRTNKDPGTESDTVGWRVEQLTPRGVAAAQLYTQNSCWTQSSCLCVGYAGGGQLYS